MLTTRRSVKKLMPPAPDAQQIQTLLQAATQVPDHGVLTPYRFVVIMGEAALQRFEQVLQQAALEQQLGEEGLAKAGRMARMAPVIIGVIAVPRERESGKTPIPVWEQQLTAGCAAYAIELAAKAQGFDSGWITSVWVGSQALRQAFGCGPQDQIVALLSVGTALKTRDDPKNTDLSTFVTYW